MPDLVSCLMPTKDRPDLVPRAVECWLAQTYPHRELVILDNGTRHATVPRHPNIRYLQVPAAPLPALKNQACDHAKGSLLAMWDDDDWSHPRRLEEQVAAMGDADMTGYSAIRYWDDLQQRSLLWDGRHPAYICGSSMMFRRDVLKHVRFPERDHQGNTLHVGSDNTFLTAFREAKLRLHVADGQERMIARIHDRNTSEKPQKRTWPTIADDLTLPIRSPRHRIVIGYLCWNTREASLLGMAEIQREAERLRWLGHDVRVIMLDNGSDDATYDALRPHLRFESGDVACRNAENRGNSVARNQIIGIAGQCDYLALIDGDIQPVPWSLNAMLRYLEETPRAYCVGPISNNCSPDGTKCTQHYDRIGDTEVHNYVAWTQYGLFRRSAIGDTRFPEGPAWDGAGWGWEDNWFGLALLERGFESHVFHDMTYPHRNRRSSIANMRQRGASPEAAWNARRDAFFAHWGHREVYPQVQQYFERLKSLVISRL